MARNRLLSTWQAMGRGAGFGPTAAEDLAVAQAVKEQTDEKDYANLASVLSQTDAFNKKIARDWARYTNSMSSDPTNPILPAGFASPDEYEVAFNKARDNKNIHKAFLPSDVGNLLGQEQRIQYENISGVWPELLGEGKWMNPITSTVGEDGSTDYSVRTIDPKTGRVFDANPTYGGTSVAELYAKGGDAAVEEGSWPPIPSEGSDQAFVQRLQNMHGRVSGASSQIMNMGQPSWQTWSPERDARERAALRAAADSAEGAYAVQLRELQRQRELMDTEQAAIAQFDTQQAKGGSSAPTSTSTSAPAPAPASGNNQIKSNPGQVVKNATDAATSNMEGPGYGVTVTFPNGAAVIDKPLGQSLYLQLPRPTTKQVGSWSLEQYDPTKLDKFSSAKFGADVEPSSETFYKTTTVIVPPEFRDYIVPRDVIPYGADFEQWSSMDPYQAEEAWTTSNMIVDKNLLRLWGTQASNLTNSPLGQELKAAKVRGITDPAAKATADRVEKFFRANRRGKKQEEILNMIRRSPDHLALFKENPFEFFAKISDTTAQDNTVIDTDGFTDFKDANKEVVDEISNTLARPAATVSSQDIKRLQEKVATAEALKIESQEALADFLTASKGREGQLAKEDAAAVFLAIASSFPKDDPRANTAFAAIAAAAPSLIERGRWDDFEDTHAIEVAKREAANERHRIDKEQLEVQWANWRLNKDRHNLNEQEHMHAVLMDKQAMFASRGDVSERFSSFEAGIRDTDAYKKLFSPQLSDLEDDITEAQFSGYVSQIMNYLDTLPPIGQQTWQEANDYKGAEGYLHVATKRMLRQMSYANKGWWAALVDSIPWVDDSDVGAEAFDTVASLVAFGVDGSPVTSPTDRIAYYKHVNRRTMQEEGEEITAFQLERDFGPVGGRRILYALTEANNAKYRKFRLGQLQGSQ